MAGSLRRLVLGFFLMFAAAAILLMSCNAVSLGDRIVMMHRGQVLHDVRGVEKERLRPEDLLDRFDDVRRREQLDESAAAMLNELYI